MSNPLKIAHIKRETPRQQQVRELAQLLVKKWEKRDREKGRKAPDKTKNSRA